MQASNPDSPSFAAKKTLRLKSQRSFWIMLIALAITLPVIVFIASIWRALISLGTASFMAAALGLGLLLAAGPVAIVVSGLMGIFLRVEACFVAPRSSLSSTDKLCVFAALLISYTPFIAALYVPLKGMITGALAFRGPGQQYVLKADPYGFWQAEAFWLMGAAALAYLATQYWLSRYRRTRNETRTEAQSL